VALVLRLLTGLLVAVSFLDSLCGLFLCLNFVRGELSPELLEFLYVAFNIEGVVYHEQVFLVAAAGLECPVERASEQESLVDNHELVVHVGSLIVIGPCRNSIVGQGLAIIALILHALVVRDDSHFDALILHVPDRVSQEIVRQVEDADEQLRFRHLDVPLELVDIVPVGKEESVHVPGLRPVEIEGDLLQMLAQVC